MAATCLAACSAMARAQDPLKDRFVFAGREAYGLLPAELACGPVVAEAKWSPDGRYILALCRSERVSAALARSRALKRDPGEPPGDLSLVVWSRETHRSHEVWRRPIGRSHVEEFRWLPGSDRAVAIVSETVPTAQGPRARREALWIRGDLEAARLVAEIPFDLRPPGWVTSPLNRVEISPTEPIAMIVNSTIRVRKLERTDGTTLEVHEWEDALTPIRENGSPGPTVRLPGVMFLLWSESGRTCYLQRDEWSPDPGQKSVRTWFEFDLRTGQVQPLAQEPSNLRALFEASHRKPQDQAASAQWPVRLTSSTSDLKQGAAVAPVRPLWLEASQSSEQPRALVCPDASWPRLSPACDAVLYLSEGAAWVRPLLRVTMADYAAMGREELRRQAVADATALAQALETMVENGEYYPRPDQLRDWLGPYLKDSPGLLDRLVYTPGAKQLLPPEAQATTVLGYVPGPGGRAMIFADGHVVWQDD
jgi:hypothetical protein